MVEAVVKAQAEQRAKVLVGARVVRKAPASRAVRTARFQSSQCRTEWWRVTGVHSLCSWP